jgi:hypothetical protein
VAIGQRDRPRRGQTECTLNGAGSGSAGSAVRGRRLWQHVPGWLNRHAQRDVACLHLRGRNVNCGGWSHRCGSSAARRSVGCGRAVCSAISSGERGHCRRWACRRARTYARGTGRRGCTRIADAPRREYKCCKFSAQTPRFQHRKISRLVRYIPLRALCSSRDNHRLPGPHFCAPEECVM